MREDATSSTISMFTCVTAGDYRWSGIDVGGKLDSYRTDSQFRIFKRYSGVLSTAETSEIFGLGKALRQKSLQPFYGRGEGSVEIYEDRFVSLVLRGTDVEVVTAHEVTMPDAMEQLVSALELAVRGLSEAPRGSSLLIGVDPGMRPCLGVDLPVLDASAAPGWLLTLLPPESDAAAIDAPTVARLQREVFTKGSAVELRTTTQRRIFVLFE